MIVLVKINHPLYTFHPPQGLLYVANSLQKNGFNVKIFHFQPDELNDNVISEIIKLKPLFVGCSVFTGEAMRSYAWLCRKIKENSKIPIVWGNAHPSLLPEECLREDYIDIVVMGEGEITAVELANSLEKGIPKLKDILGLGFKDDNGIIINPPRPFIKNLDDYRPEWSLIDVEKYLKPFYDSKRAFPISTSRGCPYDCGFCYNRKFNLCKWRAHSAQYIVKLVRELQEQYTIDGIITTDDNFFVNKKRAFEIVRHTGLPSYCETRVNYFNEEFAETLHQTKCRHLLLGMESGSDRILKFINKGITVEEILNAVRTVSKYPDIIISGSFIVAFPTETEEECKQTMRLIINLLEIKREMAFTVGYYLPYPGSRLYQVAIDNGFVPPQKTEDWEDIDRWASKSNITWVDWMTSEKAVALRHAVQLLTMTYQSRVLGLYKNYIKKKVLLLETDGFFVGFLLDAHIKNNKELIYRLYRLFYRFLNSMEKKYFNRRVVKTD